MIEAPHRRSYADGPPGEEPDPETLRERVAWGVRRGLFVAVGLTIAAAIPLVVCGVILLVAALRGDFARVADTVQGRAVIAAIPLYFGGFTAGGAIVGALLPLTRGWLGRRIVGLLAALPLSVAAFWAVAGHFGLPEMLLALLLATGWGGGLSFMFEREARVYWLARHPTGKHSRRLRW